MADDFWATAATPPADDSSFWKTAATRKDPGATKSFLGGGLQGLSLGFADELAGAWAKLTSGEGVKFGKAFQPSADDTPEMRAFKLKALADQAAQPTMYERVRDSVRQEDADAKAAHPWIHGAGNVLGAALLPVPGGAALRSGGLAARIGKGALAGAGVGTVAGLGASEAADAGGMAKDALKGTAWGAGGGALAGAVGAGLEKVATRAKSGIENALAGAVAKKGGQAEKVWRSALGAERSAVQSSSRDLEVIAREAAELPPGHPLKVLAEEMLQSESGMGIREMVLRGKLHSAPERMAEHAALVQKTAEAAEAKTPAAVQKAAEEYLANPIRTELLPRLKTYLNRSIPTAVGAAVGGPQGAQLGTLFANTIGKPVTAFAKAAQSPPVRNLFWKSIHGLSSDAPSLGQWGQPLQLAAERGLETAAPMSQIQALAEALRKREQDKELTGSSDNQGLAGY